MKWLSSCPVPPPLQGRDLVYDTLMGQDNSTQPHACPLPTLSSVVAIFKERKRDRGTKKEERGRERGRQGGKERWMDEGRGGGREREREKERANERQKGEL
jgi:hypothetical protein